MLGDLLCATDVKISEYYGDTWWKNRYLPSSRIFKKAVPTNRVDTFGYMYELFLHITKSVRVQKTSFVQARSFCFVRFLASRD